jgi:hypothetical protein
MWWTRLKKHWQKCHENQASILSRHIIGQDFSGKDGSELEEARSEFAQSTHNGFDWRAQFKQVNHGD